MTENVEALQKRITELELALGRAETRLAFLAKHSFRVSGQWGYERLHWKTVLHLPGGAPADAEISKKFIEAVDQCISYENQQPPKTHVT